MCNLGYNFNTTNNRRATKSMRTSDVNYKSTYDVAAADDDGYDDGDDDGGDDDDDDDEDNDDDDNDANDGDDDDYGDVDNNVGGNIYCTE